MLIDEQQLYNELVYDVCVSEKPNYHSLVLFVENLLEHRIKIWCYGDSSLFGGKHYEDIMQEVLIRIIKNCEDYFFKPIDNKTDKTCAEFKAWCTRVAKNFFYTYCKKGIKRQELDLSLFTNDSTDESAGLFSKEIYEKQADLDENRSYLKDCFTIVLDLGSSPHIVLTWLAVSLFMLKGDVSKIESTHLLAEKFSSMTLYQMWDMVVGLLIELEWLDVNSDQLQKQRDKLDKIHSKTGKKIGDMRYMDFYMSKGPEMSISDWINRINSQIKK